jgi:hypothetical protein
MIVDYTVQQNGICIIENTIVQCFIACRKSLLFAKYMREFQSRGRVYICLA